MGMCREQLERGRLKHRGAQVDRRWYKRQMNRAERRRARHDPENAPKRRRYFGWEM